MLRGLSVFELGKLAKLDIDMYLLWESILKKCVFNYKLIMKNIVKHILFCSAFFLLILYY